MRRCSLGSRLAAGVTCRCGDLGGPAVRLLVGGADREGLGELGAESALLRGWLGSCSVPPPFAGDDDDDDEDEDDAVGLMLDGCCRISTPC